MNVLDLFSGIGGFSLGLERAGMRTVAFCEIEDYPRRVLARHWPDVPIHRDIRELDGEQYRGAVDLVCGGFPCQDISLAGRGEGIEGRRSGLWSEMARVIGEVRPRWVLVENVSALLGRGISRVLGDLAALGFDAEWHCIPASAVGASHERDRVWIVAYPNGALGEGNGRALRIKEEYANLSVPFGREYPPQLRRAPYGLPNRMDRLRALGNAVVPQIPEIIGRAILEAETTSPKDD